MSHLAGTYEGKNPKRKERVQDYIGGMFISPDNSITAQYVDKDNVVHLMFGGGPGALDDLIDRIEDIETGAMFKAQYDVNDNGQVDRLDEERDDLVVGVFGQTVFALTRAPYQSSLGRLEVNGNLQRYGVDYTIAGTVLTWISSDFSLSPLDTMQFFYR